MSMRNPITDKLKNINNGFLAQRFAHSVHFSILATKWAMYYIGDNTYDISDTLYKHQEIKSIHYTESRNRLYTMRKILVEFRAGKVCRIGSRMSFDRRLGTCFMYEEDDMSLHFCWREYDTVDVEDDIIVTPGNAKFKCVPSYTTRRVYQLVISNVENYYYWMQEPARKDSVYCKTVNKILEAELRILNNEKTIFLQDYLRKQSSDDHTFHSNSENAVDIKSILLNDKEKVKTGKCPSSSRLLKEECIMKKKNENTVFSSNAKKGN
ncbi:hypothetical protein D917_00795 [Trichinella nativa]|uniref:Pru domain-containing protein n=1 Tax=Trichinella nativa TaxID=6335 RepID=A0A1Y3E888_9BILA|nr:hypothetical protein D917_00795 [Trichinella nativa]